jgi:hypothetical protein
VVIKARQNQVIHHRLAKGRPWVRILFNNHNSLAPSNGERPATTRDGSNDLKSKVIVGSVLKLGVINRTIFHDINSNGVQDKGEVGIDQLVVQIFDTTNSLHRIL